MSFSVRLSGMLAAGLLAVTCLSAQAQRVTFPSSPSLMPVPPGGAAARPGVGNAGGVGGMQMPGVGYGYPIYPPGMTNAPAIAGSGQQSSPYTLSTVGGYNPYVGTGATMDSMGNRSIATAPTGPQGGGGGAMGGGFWPGVGFTPNSMGYGFGLMGIADYTRAQGQYWRDIQAARMSQEFVRQEAIETARRRIQYQAWYEAMRPTAAKMRDAEMAAELDRARKDPPDVEIISGRALNVLLQSIQRIGQYNRVSSSELSQDVLKNLNLSAGTSSGNVGMLRDVTKIEWPDGLLDPSYDKLRTQLTESLQKAVAAVKDGERPTIALRRDIDAYYKQINDKLNDAAEEMSSSDFIQARRFMNELSSGIKALKDPKVDNYFNNTWVARGRTIAELVENMSKDGLTFAPASPGGEPAYRATYLGLRNFEISLQNESR